MTTEWKTTTKYIVGVSLILFTLIIIYISRSILPSLIIAGLIAFLVSPLVKIFNQRLRIPKGLAVLITYLIAIIIILLAPLILLPPLIGAFSFLIEIDYQALIDNFLTWFETSLIGIRESDLNILGVHIDLDNLIDSMLPSIQEVSPVITPSLPSIDVILGSTMSAFSVSYGVAVGIVGSVTAGFVAFIYMILAAVYLSLDGRQLFESFLGIIPEPHRYEISTLSTRLRKIWESFFRGQITLMIIVGTTVWFGLTLLGLPGAFALGIIAGILEIIPNIGPILAAIPAVIVALLQGSNLYDVNNLIFALIVIGFYILIQALENYIIVPRVLGGAVELHPLVVLTGVLVGATVWGILGALLAAPTIASFREITIYLYNKILDQDPFPLEVEMAVPDQTLLPESVNEKIQQIKNHPKSPIRSKEERSEDNDD
jgi:predicted PurR-regulated permease PerM